MLTEHVGFVVEGSELTRIARNLVTDHDWRRAVQLLRRGLHGIDYDTVYDILSGKKTLVGENTVDVVPDNESQAYQQWLDTMFAGIVSVNSDCNTWYFQPYAYVDSFCEDDLPRENSWSNRWLTLPPFNAPSEYVSGYGAVRRWGQARCLFYANDPTLDRIEPAGKRMVLWKFLTTPPPWFVALHTWEEGLTAFLKQGCTLQRRGASITHTPSRLRRTQRWTEKGKEREIATKKQADTVDAYQKVVDAIGGESSTTPPPPVVPYDQFECPRPPDDPPIPVPKLDADHGYIDRDGVFYVCGYAAHKYLAQRLFKHRYSRDVDLDKAEKLAEEGGIVKCAKSHISGHHEAFWAINRLPPSEAQQQTILNWAVRHQAMDVADRLIEYFHPPEAQDE